MQPGKRSAQECSWRPALPIGKNFSGFSVPPWSIFDNFNAGTRRHEVYIEKSNRLLTRVMLTPSFEPASP
jgi:hypothetical protein